MVSSTLEFGGLKYNANDGLIYGAEPYEGTIFSVDSHGDEVVKYDHFHPPVVRNLDKPSCIRFGSDNEIFIFGRGEGNVVQVTDYQ
ncbi:hypothetical protein [Halolamina sp.]|jgi:hypothetical protein|uniref:hypothetical protein n=1 Tax=Halolamina sp. TaxID=1940283 RepID=UPI0006779C5F